MEQEQEQPAVGKPWLDLFGGPFDAEVSALF